MAIRLIKNKLWRRRICKSQSDMKLKPVYWDMIILKCCRIWKQAQHNFGQVRFDVLAVMTKTGNTLESNIEARSPKHRCPIKVISIAYLCVCVFVCACARVWMSTCACVKVCGRRGVCLRACSLAYPACNAPPYCDLLFLWLHHIYRHFRKKSYWTRNVCSDFLYNIYLKYFSL